MHVIDLILYCPRTVPSSTWWQFVWTLI